MMVIKTKANLNFKCSCGVRIGTCKNLEHPQIFEEYLSNSNRKYIERWALSKYTIHDNEISKINKNKGHTKIGGLIYDYKYKKHKDNQTLDKLSESEISLLKNDRFREIYRHVKFFLDGYFPNGTREFNATLPIPPTSFVARTIPLEISKQLEKDALINLKDLITVTSETFDEGHLKNITSFAKKEDILKKKFVLGDAKLLENVTGILVIDDVYKTGGTARRALNIINMVAPDIPKYFLSVSFTVLAEISPTAH